MKSPALIIASLLPLIPLSYAFRILSSQNINTATISSSSSTSLRYRTSHEYEFGSGDDRVRALTSEDRLSVLQVLETNDAWLDDVDEKKRRRSVSYWNIYWQGVCDLWWKRECGICFFVTVLVCLFLNTQLQLTDVCVFYSLYFSWSIVNGNHSSSYHHIMSQQKQQQLSPTYLALFGMSMPIDSHWLHCWNLPLPHSSNKTYSIINHLGHQRRASPPKRRPPSLHSNPYKITITTFSTQTITKINSNWYDSPLRGVRYAEPPTWPTNVWSPD